MFLRILGSIRTNNFQDEHCIEKIQALWQEQEEAVKEAFAQGEPVYAVYHDYASADKEDPQAILHAWQRIWQAEEIGELHRDYTIDFEKYDPDQTVAVFIATK